MRIVAFLAVLALVALPYALADGDPKPPDGPPDGAPVAPKEGKAGGEKPADAGKPEEPKKPDSVSPFQRILKELTALVAREKSKPTFDKGLVSDLEDIVKTYARMAEKPVKLEDLSEADRLRLEDEMRKKLADEQRPLPPLPGGAGGDPGGPDAGAPGGGGGDWLAREKQRRIDRITEGVDMTDAQREKVLDLLSQYIDDAFVAWQNGDVGAVNGMKSDLEKQLKPVVGPKKAKDIINNVNREASGFRGGRGR
jgi:hypothetical protein